MAATRDRQLPVSGGEAAVSEQRRSGNRQLDAADPFTAESVDPFRQIVENLEDVVWLTDVEKSQMHYVNPAYEAVWGHSTATLYERPTSFLDAVHPEDRDRVRAAIERQFEGDYDEEYRIRRPDGSIRWIHDRSVTIEDPAGNETHVAGIAQDITERKHRERTLTELNEVTRDLFVADTVREVGQIAVSAASDRLRLQLVSIYLYDESTDALHPVARADDVAGILGELPVFSGADSLAWEVYESGETAVYDDVQGQPGIHNDETPVRSELIVPVGDHGVLLAGSTAVDVFDDTDVEFGELLATNVAAALDQVGYRQRLETQNERLRDFSRLNSTIRTINQSLVSATTVAEIATEVCETIVRNDPYRAAWIGEHSGDGELRIRAATGIDLDTGTVTEPYGRMAEAAREAGTVRVFEGFDTRSGEDTAHEQLLAAGCRQAAVVPLVAGDASYGVLALYTDWEGLFDEEERDILDELGQTVGQAMRAAETRRTLMSETAVELEFEVTDTDSFIVDLTAELACRLELRGLVPVEGDCLLYYGALEGGDAEAAVEYARARDGVEAARVVSESEDGATLEFTVSRENMVGTLASRGATIQVAVVDRGEGRVVAEVGPETDVRTLVTRLQECCPGTELRRKRELDRPVTTVQEFRASLTDRLTDRQLDVLRASFQSGYFEWPRESTAEDVADSFGVSSSTIHFHLRHAQQSLLEAFFAEGTRAPGEE